MRCSIISILVTVCCFLALRTMAEQDPVQQDQQLLDIDRVATENQVEGDAIHSREKRTLFLKKKLLGAGLLGFGLGIVKGYKAGYFHGPEVHHVYLSPSPLKYVEYVEKPIYIENIVPKPIYRQPHSEYAPVWSKPEPSSSYSSW